MRPAAFLPMSSETSVVLQIDKARVATEGAIRKRPPPRNQSRMKDNMVTEDVLHYDVAGLQVVSMAAQNVRSWPPAKSALLVLRFGCERIEDLTAERKLARLEEKDAEAVINALLNFPGFAIVRHGPGEWVDWQSADAAVELCEIEYSQYVILGPEATSRVRWVGKNLIEWMPTLPEFHQIALIAGMRLHSEEKPKEAVRSEFWRRVNARRLGLS